MEYLWIIQICHTDTFHAIRVLLISIMVISGQNNPYPGMPELNPDPVINANIPR